MAVTGNFDGNGRGDERGGGRGAGGRAERVACGLYANFGYFAWFALRRNSVSMMSAAPGSDMRISVLPRPGHVKP